MPDIVIFGLGAAALQLVRQYDPNCTLAGILGEVAGGRADQSIGGLISTIEQRLAQVTSDENHDIKKALLESYWVAALLVAGDYGSRVSAPLTEAEILAVPSGSSAWLSKITEKAAQAWTALSERPDGPVGVLLMPQQDQIRQLYRFLLQKAAAADEEASLADGDVVEDAYRRVERLLVSDPRGHEDVTGLAVQSVTVAVDRQLVSIAAQEELRSKLRELMAERWPLYFTALFQNAIKSNEKVKSIVYARLLADLHVRTSNRDTAVISPEQLEQGLAGLETKIQAGFHTMAASQQKALEYLREILQRLGGNLSIAARTAGPLPSLSIRIFGREQEAQALCSMAARHDGDKIVAIVAPPGFGKTGLLTAALQQARDANHGQEWLRTCARAVLAWDFRDPSQAKLPALLQRISDLFDGETHKALEVLAVQDLPAAEKCARAFALLNIAAGPPPGGRIWLLWQNAENLLDERRTFRDAELGAFARLMWEHEHRCCLVIESRLLPELPPTRRRLQAFGDSRCLEHGLSERAAMEWLRSERERSESPGLQRASDADLEALVRRVWGVPLALSSVVSYLNGPGSEIPLAHLLKDAALFAEFDQADESLREQAFRPIVRRHFERLHENERRLLGFIAQMPFPVRKEALAIVLPDAKGLEAALSGQRRSRMLIAGDSVATGGLPATLYMMMVPLQEAIAPSVELLTESLAYEFGERGLRTLQQQDHRLGLHMTEIAERILSRLAAAGRADLHDNLATALVNKGNALRALGQVSAAIADYEAAIEIRTRLIANGRTELEDELATARMNKANALCAVGQAAAAVPHYDATIEILARLVAAGGTKLENDLGNARMNKGNALCVLERAAAAVAEYDAAIEIFARPVAAAHTERMIYLGTARMNKGNALCALEEAAAAVPEYDAAIEIFDGLIAAGRTELEYDLATARMNKGYALGTLDRVAAVAEYEPAIKILTRLVAAGRTELRPTLAQAHTNRALVRQTTGHQEDIQPDLTTALHLLSAAERDGMQGLEPLFARVRELLSQRPLSDILELPSSP